jgi:hypothetical protein
MATPTKYKDVREMIIEELLEELNNSQELTHHRSRTIKEPLRNAGFGLNRKTSKWEYQGKGEAPLNELGSTFMSQENTSKNEKAQTEKTENTTEQSSEPKNIKVQSSTPKNKDFTEKEIQSLKQIIEEREKNIELFYQYRVYEELEKVPVGAEQVRSAFNMSKETTERLKKYASVRRLPLQDLVELAVINLLERYDQ